MDKNQAWNLFYTSVSDPSWPLCPTMDDIVHLPDHIKKEIIINFNGHFLFVENWSDSAHYRVDLVPLDSKYKFLLPYKCNDLIRIGSINDGGYVVPKRLVDSADSLLSGGIANNWDFEKQWADLNPNAIIRGYDRDVDSGTNEYHQMWSGNKTHYPNYFAANDVPFEHAVKSIPGQKVFVKLDIEGAEYDCIDALVANKDRIIGLVIEFEDVIPHTRFLSSIARLQTDFAIVHLHANNVCSVPPVGQLPYVLELTMIRKDYLDSTETRNPISISELDRPNDYTKCDLFLYFSE